MREHDDHRREEMMMEICDAFHSKAEKTMTESRIREYMFDLESRVQDMSDKELKKMHKKARKGKL